MEKVRRKLTKDQRQRRVIFSSALSPTKSEKDADTIHEVFAGEKGASEKIRRLKDDSFFDNSPYNYNIIREG